MPNSQPAGLKTMITSELWLGAGQRGEGARDPGTGGVFVSGASLSSLA